MSKHSMSLTDWSQLYLKHQDLLKKTIQDMSFSGNALTVKKTSGNETWIVVDELSLDQLNVTGIMCLNTKANILLLAKSWPQVRELLIKIVFANPATNERWVLVPAHHARVCDEKHLKDGLLTLYSSIAKVTK